MDAGGLGLGARIAGPQRVAAGRNVGEAKAAVDVGRGAALQLLNLQLRPLKAACAAAVKHDAGQRPGKRRGRKTSRRHEDSGKPGCTPIRLKHCFPPICTQVRSAERQVGKEWVSTCRSRWSTSHSKKK